MPKQTIFEMPFTKVYPMLILKAEKKGRNKEEVLDCQPFHVHLNVSTIFENVPKI